MSLHPFCNDSVQLHNLCRKTSDTQYLVVMHVTCTIMLRLHCSLPKRTLIVRWKSRAPAKLMIRCCALRHVWSTCICTTMQAELRLKSWSMLPEVLLSTFPSHWPWLFLPLMPSEDSWWETSCLVSGVGTSLRFFKLWLKLWVVWPLKNFFFKVLLCWAFSPRSLMTTPREML